MRNLEFWECANGSSYGTVVKTKLQASMESLSWSHMVAINPNTISKDISQASSILNLVCRNQEISGLLLDTN